MDEKTKILRAAGRTIYAPRWLDKQAKAFFREIVKERAVSDWPEHDLSVAAFLAQAMADLKREEALLAKERIDIDMNPSPRLKTIVERTNSIMRYRRTLNLHQAGRGSARRAAERTRRHQVYEAGAAKLKAIDGGLLA